MMIFVAVVAGLFLLGNTILVVLLRSIKQDMKQFMENLSEPAQNDSENIID